MLLGVYQRWLRIVVGYYSEGDMFPLSTVYTFDKQLVKVDNEYMKVSFNFKLLEKNICPNMECEKPLLTIGIKHICESCGYTIKEGTLQRVISESYRKGLQGKTETITLRKRTRDVKLSKMEIALQEQEKEREYNRAKIARDKQRGLL